MGRWQPGAQGRLIRSALELYAERGFEQTTALEIAERAGVTERTFFRYFADKREVLFEGSNELQAHILDAVTTAPPQMQPVEIVGHALESAAALLEGNRDFAQHRAAVIAANPSLQERELLKLDTLGEAIAEGLRGRGVPDPVAGLAAQTAITVFKVGFESWIRDGESSSDLGQCLRDTLAQLRGLTAGA